MGCFYFGKENFMQIYGGGDKLVTINQLYRLLGVGNLLTDDEMNIANALKSPAAQGAISNMSYSNGVSHFHYKGIADYERINWAFTVSPNTNYRMEIVANSTSEMTFLDPNNRYIPWGIKSKADLNDSTFGEFGNWHLPLPWSEGISGSITFNSGSYSKLYLFANFGLAQDGIDTDVTLQIKLFKNDSIQTEIDQLRSQIDQPSFNNALPYHKNPLTANDDLNNVLENGIYVLQGQTPKNAPALGGGESWGTIIVWKHDDGQIIQRFFLQDIIYFRWLAMANGTPKSQTEWIKEADARDIENLQNQINQLKK